MHNAANHANFLSLDYTEHDESTHKQKWNQVQLEACLYWTCRQSKHDAMVKPAFMPVVQVLLFVLWRLWKFK